MNIGTRAASQVHVSDHLERSYGMRRRVGVLFGLGLATVLTVGAGAATMAPVKTQPPDPNAAQIKSLEDQIKSLRDQTKAQIAPLEAQIQSLRDKLDTDIKPLQAQLETLRQQGQSPAVKALDDEETAKLAALADREKDEIQKVRDRYTDERKQIQQEFQHRRQELTKGNK
jgi:Skp family chaperone for outer membrane proteins